MPFQSDAAGVELDPMRVEGSLVSIQRSLLVRDSGIVATIRISATGDPPIKYQVVDPLPASFDLDELGFHPEFNPAHGRIDSHQIVISGLLDSADSTVVKYGLCPATPQPSEAVDSAQSANPPSIELEEALDAAATDEVDFETPALARGESTTSSLYTNVKESVFGPTTEDGPSVGNVDTTESEAAAEAVAEAISDLEAAQAEDSASTADPDSVEALFKQAESAIEPDTPQPEEEATSDTSPSPEAGMVDQLLAELQAAPDETRRALADELAGSIDTKGGSLPRSAEVRLQQLESRIEEFAAYSTALRDLIDEHGTPSEFLTDITQDLDDLQASIDDVRSDLEDLDDEQSALSADLEELETSVDRLAERAADERSAIKTDLEAAIDEVQANAAESRETIQHDLDTIETDLDALETTLADLREDVEDGKARRRAIAEALSGDREDPSG